MSDQIIFEGKAYYAMVHSPSKDKKQYKVTIGNLNKETKDTLKKNGIIIRTEGDEDKPRYTWGSTVTLSNKLKPRVVDAKKNPIPANVLIGNGSTVRVIGKPYTVNFTDAETGKDGKYTGLNLLALQILDLVKYERTNIGETEEGEVYENILDAFEEEDGFENTVPEVDLKAAAKKPKKVKKDSDNEFDFPDEEPF